jgi:threonine dehydrogenase-like Zn-dependent dehydrogenase
MKALVWHGKEDVRCDTVTAPSIEEPRDAIIKVTSCAICGSDLHLFHNLIPAMLPGDILGHESMGEVVEVGSEAARTLKKGDRVVIPFTIYCGECDQCRRGNFSLCQRSNRKPEVCHEPARPPDRHRPLAGRSQDPAQRPELVVALRSAGAAWRSAPWS